MKSIQRLGRERRAARRQAEMSRLIQSGERPVDAPDTFYAGGVDSNTERASINGWMPHEYRPIIGFRRGN